MTCRRINRRNPTRCQPSLQLSWASRDQCPVPPPTTRTDTHPAIPIPTADRSLEVIRTQLYPVVFLDFHRAREREQNEADGYGDTRNVHDHTPVDTNRNLHWQLSCSRKVYYSDKNAPAESKDPHRILNIGQMLEAYLEDLLETVDPTTLKSGPSSISRPRLRASRSAAPPTT